METPIERFARHVLKKPLYPYQVPPALAILHSIENNLGWIITVMMSRQSGKNQLSAVIEAFLLFTRKEGSIIKAAPTFTPQIIASQRRLMSMLENPLMRDRIWTSYGQIGLAPRPDRGLKQHHVGPYVQFFSADPESNVVGATASLLLEVDEAQDVSAEKFDRDFRPMGATKNATTVMYGTAWTEDTLLARQRAINLELEERTGEKRHFEYDWRAAASCNPHYKQFVEAEIARLGKDHLAIQTQYFLRPISGAGHFFSDMQRLMLAGSHTWEPVPQDDEFDSKLIAWQLEQQGEPGIYVAGLDVGGEERADPSDPERVNTKRDSTVLTVGRISFNELGLPELKVIHHAWWTGMHYLDQFAQVGEMVRRWNIRRLAVDNTGIGAGLASMLVAKYGEERVTLYPFTRQSKSRLGYQLLSLTNAGRLKLYRREDAPSAIYDECWSQISKAKYRLPAAEIIDFYVQPGEGHDDFLISLALCCEAMSGMSAGAGEGAVIKPLRMYDDGRF